MYPFFIVVAPHVILYCLFHRQHGAARESQMITVNGIVTFYLQDVFPFIVRYEATADENGEVIDINEEMEDCSIDIFKHDLEWKYQIAMQQAVQLDVQKQIAYINS